MQKRITLARKSGDRHLLANSLTNQAMVHVFNHEWDQAEGPLREADRLFVEIGSSYGINQTRFWRTQVFFGREEIERAKAEANLFVEYCQRVGEKNMQSTVLFFLGLIAELENDLQSTLYYSQKSLDLAKEVGSPDNLATIFVSLGRLKYLQGDFEVAIQYIRDGLEIVKSSKISGDTPSMVFCQISGMLVDRKPHIAAQLLGYSEIFWQEANFPRDPTFDQPYFDRFYAAARAKLGEAEFASAWEAGLKMTVDEAIKLALKTVEKM